MSKANKTSPAFTLVELMVAIPMVIVVLGIIIGLMIALVGNVITSNAKNQMIYDVQTALNQIEQDAFLSTSFVNTYTAPSPQMKNDTSGIYDATPAAGVTPDIVFNQLGTTKNPMDPDRGIVYYARPNSCDVDKQAANDPFFLKVAYFVRSGVLYKRTIVPLHNTNTGSPNGDTVCDDPWQRGSCTEGYAANVRCETKDTKLLEGVDSLNVTYFNKATPGTAVSDAGNADSIRATITLQRKSAGDTHSYSGGVSATRTNSLPTATAVPGTPVISLSGDYPPGGAVFTWRPVANASSYDVKYSVNNGSTWSAVKSIPANQIDLSYNTIEATGSQNIFGGETVKVSVVAKNELGSKEGTGTFAIPVWKPCGPLAPVLNYGNDGLNWAEASYTYTKSGIVMLRGRVKNTGGSTVANICNLPEGYRPDWHFIFRSYTDVKPAYGEVWPNGRVYVSSANNGFATLDGISYIPAGSSYTWNNFSLTSGWVPWASYGDNPYAPPRYALDSEGRTHIQIMMNPGDLTDNAVIASIPNAAIAQMPYYHLPSASWDDSFNSVNAIGLTPNSAKTALEVRSKGGVANWRQFHFMGYTGGGGNSYSGDPWLNLSLANGTGYGGIYSSPQYKKASDNVVTLRGLLYTGSTVYSDGTAIATLADTYCPDRAMLFPVNNNNKTALIKVTPGNGISCQIQYAITVSAGAIGLDGINWRTK